jgi:hypothetical protein
VTEAEHVERVTRDVPTKAEKIRRLHAAGYTRSEIAAYLGISYQHARNVLVATPASWRPPRLPPRPAPPLAAEDEPPPYVRLLVEPDGRLILPASLVATLGAAPGRTVGWRVADGELRLLGPRAGPAFARQLVAERAADDTSSWSDALIAQRRAESDDD